VTPDPADLLDVVDLKQTTDDHFVGRNAPPDLPRVFGGQVAAHAVWLHHVPPADDRSRSG
jgi:acyl-CoA thioesterase